MKKKILLFENSLFLLEVYLAALTDANYAVVSVETVEQCLREALKKPDLIILDVIQPKLNGLMILKSLKENSGTKDVPVVMLASVDQQNLLKEVLELGAQGFLLKERLTPQDLVARIDEFLEKPPLPIEPVK